MVKRFGAIKNPIFDMPHYMSVRSGWRGWGCLLEEEEEPGEEEEDVQSELSPQSSHVESQVTCHFQLILWLWGHLRRSQTSYELSRRNMSCDCSVSFALTLSPVILMIWNHLKSIWSYQEPYTWYATLDICQVRLESYTILRLSSGGGRRSLENMRKVSSLSYLLNQTT